MSGKQNSKKTKKWVAIGSVVILLGTMAIVWTVTKQFSYLNFFYNPNESGYKMLVEINKVGHNSFEGDIVEVKDIIKKQQLDNKAYMSWNPLEYTKYFDSIQDSFNYLGIETSYVAIDKDIPATLKVSCNKSGEIEKIIIMTDYEHDGNNVQIWYYIFTDLIQNPCEEEEIIDTKLIENSVDVSNEDSIIFESVVLEKNEYQITSETLHTGKQVPVITSGTNTENMETAESYFSVDKVTYSINVVSRIGNKMKAKETLTEILKLFE